jgi:hypothetical protein
MATSSLSMLYSITSLASFLLSASGLHFSLCMMLLTLDLFLWLFARHAHNRSFQIPSSRIDTRKMSFFPRTVRDWNLLAPDIVELDTPYSPMMLLTLDLFLWLFATYLAALLCTASTLFISACVYGSQTVLAYSTSGRARVKYACSFILIDGIFRFLRRKPRILFALLVI